MHTVCVSVLGLESTIKIWDFIFYSQKWVFLMRDRLASYGIMKLNMKMKINS